MGDLDLTKKEAFQSQLSELAKSAPTKVEDTDATSETLVLGEGGTAIGRCRAARRCALTGGCNDRPA